MAIDIISEPVSGVLGDRFAAKADQNRFRSSFAVVSGKCPTGFKTVAEMREDQIHPHISARMSGWVPLEEANGGKNAKEGNHFKHNGVDYCEVVAPAEDFELKYKLESTLSRNNAEGIMDAGVQAARATGDLSPVEKTQLIPVEDVQSASALEDQLAAFKQGMAVKK